ncbi:hypothetical protein [Desulfuromonas thiophila]|uniref:Uncharacterized protein n=1 Tax=Desulfuromonas thiophila TaxID=57664 RepID=A0A1G7BQL1_9BACT|nr:hypothetical protein [Desulfuromonas thiophila]SDE29267.1 hypothetical protein SAMN05661003_1072 [Desulfuromonas thiophila]
MLSIFNKLGDIIFEPINLVTDWAREPLKKRDHLRCLEAKEHEMNLEVKKKTEIVKIISEIEEIRKDKDFSRMKAVSDAIMQYQECLTKLNINAINAIGHMQLDLREKAQTLVYDKTRKYKQLQDDAHLQAQDEIIKIETMFSGNESAKNILYRSVDIRLANIISTAQNFLVELNNDITVLNKSINLLTEQGQTFIESHLQQFHVVTNSGLLPPVNQQKISSDGLEE